MAGWNEELEGAVAEAAIPVSRDGDGGFGPIVEAVGDARFVLIGEASHGTHEFYAARAALTRTLIERKGFDAVIVEADWPDAYRVNRYVRGAGADGSAEEALRGFKRFPGWMWRNRDVEAFVAWLREWNAAAGGRGPRCGFYGMDLYSLHQSMAAVLAYLDRVDPAAAERARFRYGCFEQFGEDPQAYGYAASFDVGENCQQEVVSQLVEMQRRAAELAQGDGRMAEDEHFHAEQNARLVKNAEAYYRSMFEGVVPSWNLRDRHMMETIELLAGHLDRRMGRTRAVVWAHNSHLGDARATEMAQRGEVNVGQLMRERFGLAVFTVGLTTHTGTVTAASRWDGPTQVKRVRASLPGSYEHVMHGSGAGEFLLVMSRAAAARDALAMQRLERAIGVIYLPESERLSHYFYANLAEQFDAIVHYDVTSAVEPLDAGSVVDRSEAPETYPSSL